MSDGERQRIDRAIVDIVDGYARGTRHGIRRDSDGLLACGEPGVQLTWMDAKIGAWVVTPRIGKPVEIQALWVHALVAAGKREARFRAWAESAQRALEARFWNEQRGMLFDVVDDDHVSGAVDANVSPQPDLRRGRPAAHAAQPRARAPRGRRGRTRAVDAAWPALARAGGTALRATLPRRSLGTRRRLPSRHGVAVAR